jgi:hypothetical protein
MTITESRLPEPFTVVLLGSDLPESLASRFPQRPADDTRFVVTLEPEQTDEEKDLALKSAIQEGIDDSQAGHVLDGETVFAELKARFPAP